MRIGLTTEIEATPDRIWPWLEEPDRMEQWMEGVKETRQEGAPRVGQRFEMQIKEGRKWTRYDGEVTIFDKPRTMEVKMWGGAFPPGMEMFARYDLRASGARATTLDYECRCEPRGFGQRLMWATIGRLFGKMVARKFLRNLKGCVEGTRAPA